MTPSSMSGSRTPGTAASRCGTDDPLEACVQRAIAGDDVAFARLYLALQPKLLRYASVLVGSARGDADDVTAEAWLQIARDLRGFSGDLDAFRGWTTRIVRNRAMDLLRARSRRPTTPSGVHDIGGLDELFERPELEDAWDGAAERIGTERALALIATLPREQGEAVLLRAVIGLDAEAAGAVLGKRAGAVRVAAHRGLKRLARQLADDTEAGREPGPRAGR